MSLLISTAWAQSAAATTAGAAQSGPSLLATFLPMLAIFGFMYFFLIRPQAKRAKDHRSMIDSLAAGTEVVFAGGLMGEVRRIEGDYAIVALNQGVEVKVQRASIVSVLPPGTLSQLS